MKPLSNLREGELLNKHFNTKVSALIKLHDIYLFSCLFILLQSQVFIERTLTICLPCSYCSCLISVVLISVNLTNLMCSDYWIDNSDNFDSVKKN